MLDWFSALPMMMQVFWGCAIVGSAIFVVQVVLMLIGIDSDVADMDFDTGDTLDLGGGMSLLSIKSLINFIVGFGWGGVCLSSSIESKSLLVIAALVVGLLFSLLYLFLYKKLRGLESNGAFDISNCEGKIADVYLRIPANRGGQGKIQISVNGSVHEIAAITDGRELPSGSKVTVVEVIDKSLVRVK